MHFSFPVRKRLQGLVESMQQMEEAQQELAAQHAAQQEQLQQQYLNATTLVSLVLSTAHPW